MNTVIVKIFGEGAYRVPNHLVPTLRAGIEATRGEFYVIDNCGRTWAPMPDGEYDIWEDNPHGVAIAHAANDTSRSDHPDPLRLILERINHAIEFADRPGNPQYVHSEVYVALCDSRDMLDSVLNPGPMQDPEEIEWNLRMQHAALEQGIEF